MKTIAALACSIFLLLCGCSSGTSSNLASLVEKIRTQKFAYNEDLASVSDPSELRILRNAVFACKGYIFKDQKLRDYFAKYTWYKPTLSNVDSLLTDFDRSIIEAIQWKELSGKEKEMLANHVSPFNGLLNKSESELVGFWHLSPGVAAGYSGDLAFYPNRIVVQGYNEMDDEERRVATFYDWQANDGSLTLREFAMETRVGGEQIKSFGSVNTPTGIEFASPVLTVEHDQQSAEYPFAFDFDSKWQKPTITVFNRTYWKLSDDPKNGNSFSN